MTKIFDTTNGLKKVTETLVSINVFLVFNTFLLVAIFSLLFYLIFILSTDGSFSLIGLIINEFMWVFVFPYIFYKFMMGKKQ